MEQIANTTPKLIPLSLQTMTASMHHVASIEGAREAYLDITSKPIVAVGLDLKYQYTKPAITMKRCQWSDIKSIKPITVTFALWITSRDGKEDGVANYIFDVRDHDVVSVLGKIFRDLQVPWISHDAKVTLFCLWVLGIDTSRMNIHDTHVAAKCLDLGLYHKRALPTRKELFERIQDEMDLEQFKADLFSLAGQCKKYGICYPFEHKNERLDFVFSNLKLHDAVTAEMVEFSSSNANMVLQLYSAQQTDIIKSGLHHHLYSIEFPYCAANAWVEWCGIFIDHKKQAFALMALEKSIKFLEQSLSDMDIISHITPESFMTFLRKKNLIKHFSDRTQSGEVSLDSDALKELEHLHPAIKMYRTLQKLKPYLNNGLLAGQFTSVDGRVHPNRIQLGADTGRNTERDPHVSGLSKFLRPIVCAQYDDSCVFEIDYSQKELGIAGAVFGNEALIDAYNTGDVYVATAKKILRSELFEADIAMPTEEFKKKHKRKRNRMKPFLLGIIYGRKASSLAKELGVSEKEAPKILNSIFDAYPGLKESLKDTSRSGYLRGYASITSGLRRQIPAGCSFNSWVSNFLRNTPIQGAAAVVFKLGLIGLYHEFRGTDVNVIITAHDSYVIECPKAIMESVIRRSKFILEHAMRSIFPALNPKVEINDKDTTCWNKDGESKSIENVLCDPKNLLK